MGIRRVAPVLVVVALASSSRAGAGPVYLDQRRAIRALDQELTADDFAPFDERVSAEFRAGPPPTDDAGARADVSQRSTIGPDGIDVAGSMSAASLASTDGASTGFAAGARSIVEVLFEVTEPTRYTLTALNDAPRGDGLGGGFLDVTARIEPESRDRTLAELTADLFPVTETAAGELQPGRYWFGFFVGPSGFDPMDGQSADGTYAGGVAFSTAPALIPLPPAVLPGLLAGAGLLVARYRAARVTKARS